jgi:hypothetical protein
MFLKFHHQIAPDEYYKLCIRYNPCKYDGFHVITRFVPYRRIRQFPVFDDRFWENTNCEEMTWNWEKTIQPVICTYIYYTLAVLTPKHTLTDIVTTRYVVQWERECTIC